MECCLTSVFSAAAVHVNVRVRGKFYIILLFRLAIRGFASLIWWANQCAFSSFCFDRTRMRRSADFRTPDSARTGEGCIRSLSPCHITRMIQEHGRHQFPYDGLLPSWMIEERQRNGQIGHGKDPRNSGHPPYKGEYFYGSVTHQADPTRMRPHKTRAVSEGRCDTQAPPATLT